MHEFDDGVNFAVKLGVGEGFDDDDKGGVVEWVVRGFQLVEECGDGREGMGRAQ